MKAFPLLCFGLVLAATLSQVKGLWRRSKSSPSRRPALATGWRRENGPCVCRTPNPTGHHSPRPTGHEGPHPTGHHGPHPTGHHGPHPTGHHGPHPTGHHGPHPTGHHGPHPTGHHGPHPTGHHGPHHTGHHGPHPTGHHGPHPTGHHHSGPHSTGQGPHHTGHHGPHHMGPHPSSNPSRRPWHSRQPYRRCVCRKRPEKLAKIKFRMNKKWKRDLSVTKSMTYIKTYKSIIMKVKKVLRKARRFSKMTFRKGSIVVMFNAVYNVPKNGSIAEDPEKALRNAIRNGDMKDLNIYPDSLAVTQSYTGIKVSEWETSLRDCFKCRCSSQIVQRTRTCTEIDASCDGIPLTDKSTCKVACPKHHAHKGRSRGMRTFVIVGVVIGLAFIVAAFVVVIRLKKTNAKYISTSPSVTSIKELTKNDELQFGLSKNDDLRFNSKC